MCKKSRLQILNKRKHVLPHTLGKKETIYSTKHVFLKDPHPLSWKKDIKVIHKNGRKTKNKLNKIIPNKTKNLIKQSIWGNKFLTKKL